MRTTSRHLVDLTVTVGGKGISDEGLAIDLKHALESVGYQEVQVKVTPNVGLEAETLPGVTAAAPKTRARITGDGMDAILPLIRADSVAARMAIAEELYHRRELDKA